jgi:hypothetical protein
VQPLGSPKQLGAYPLGPLPEPNPETGRVSPVVRSKRKTSAEPLSPPKPTLLAFDTKAT